MQNWDQTLLSQYVDSPTLIALLQSLNTAIDPSADIQAFYNNIWNISTAVGRGLDIWGQIVDVSRSLQVAYNPAYFGFNEAYTAPTAATGAQPFQTSPMYNGTQATQTYTLGDADYRTLILVKAAANISNLSVPSVNALLSYLFRASGRISVQDMGGMKQRYVVEFIPTNVQTAIILNAGVIPRSAGVLASAIIYTFGTTFSFASANGVPFGVGTFFSATRVL